MNKIRNLCRNQTRIWVFLGLAMTVFLVGGRGQDRSRHRHLALKQRRRLRRELLASTTPQMLLSNCVAVAFGGTVDKTNRSLIRRKGVAEPTTMNTKKKQPKRPQSQPRKFRDLQSKKNPKGGVGVAGSRNAQRKETPTLPPAI
jgi:hypothetical protein